MHDVSPEALKEAREQMKRENQRRKDEAQRRRAARTSTDRAVRERQAAQDAQWSASALRSRLPGGRP